MIVDLFIMYSGGWLGSCAAARPHKVRANAARILKRGLLLGVGKRENDDSDSRAGRPSRRTFRGPWSVVGA